MNGWKEVTIVEFVNFVSARGIIDPDEFPRVEDYPHAQYADEIGCCCSIELSDGSRVCVESDYRAYPSGAFGEEPKFWIKEKP